MQDLHRGTITRAYCGALTRPPIGGQDGDGASYRCSAPYTLSRFAGLPLKGKREIWREKQGVIYFIYHSGVPPFGGWRHHLSPASGGTITRAYCSATYERIALWSFIVPPLRGGEGGAVRHQRGEKKPPEVADYRNAFHVI